MSVSFIPHSHLLPKRGRIWLCLYHYYYYYLYDVIMKHVIIELKDGNLSRRLESAFFRGTWSANSIYSKGLKRIYGPKNSRAKQEEQNAILVNLCSRNTASTIRAYAHWRRVLGKERCARLQSAYVCTLTGRKMSFLNWVQNAWNNCNYSAQSNRVGKKNENSYMNIHLLLKMFLTQLNTRDSICYIFST